MKHFVPGDEEVEVVGFYYLTGEGEPFLSAFPDLKSCCRGTKERRDEQLFLKEPLSLREGEPVRMSGVVAEEARHLVLKNGALKEERLSLVELGGALSLFILIFLMLRRLF